MTMDQLHLDRIKNVSLQGWLVVAAAAAAGHFLLKSMIATVGLGGAALYVVLQNTPCCSGCAAGSGCAGGNPVVAANPDAISGGALSQ
jgi:hypothetical protein